eukprot:1292033-Lingulodinium_polyedra.AAC.1
MPAGYCFAKFDVREFFMSGTPMQLVDAIRKCLPSSPESIPLLAAVQWLLEHQFISSNQVPGLYRVIIGSGMGLAHSSSIADASFYSHVDVMVLQRGFLRAYQILAWW